MDKFINWLIAGGLFTIAGFCAATFWRINKIKDNVDKRIDRNYQRLDEVKDELEKETVPQRVCDILHAATQKDMEEIKEIQKGVAEKLACIPAIKLGLDLLLKNNGLKTTDGK